MQEKVSFFECWKSLISDRPGHAFIRAMERGISPDMIEATIKSVQLKGLGKIT